MTSRLFTLFFGTSRRPAGADRRRRDRTGGDDHVRHPLRRPAGYGDQTGAVARRRLLDRPAATSSPPSWPWPGAPDRHDRARPRPHRRDGTVADGGSTGRPRGRAARRDRGARVRGAGERGRRRQVDPARRPCSTPCSTTTRRTTTTSSCARCACRAPLVGLLVGAALGAGGAAHAGPHPQPARRPRHARRQRRRRPRSSSSASTGSASTSCSATCGSPSPAPPSPRVVVYSLGLARPRGRHARQARPRRRRPHRAARLDHHGDPADRRRHARPVPLLGRRLARRPRRRRRRRRGPVHRRRPACMALAVRAARSTPSPSATTWRAASVSASACPRDRRRRRHRAALRRGDRGGGPDRLRRAHRAARRPGRSPAPTTAGCSRTRSCWRPCCCSAPTSSAASSPGPARSRSASSPRSSARRCSSSSSAGARWPSCDAPPSRPAPGAPPSHGGADAAPSARSTTRRRSCLVGARRSSSFCVSISVGDFPIPLRDVVPAIFGVGTEDAEFIVRTLRLPRALTGVLVGASFGRLGRDLPEPRPQPAGQPRHHRHRRRRQRGGRVLHRRAQRVGRRSTALGAPRRRARHRASPSTCSPGSGGVSPLPPRARRHRHRPRCSSRVTAVPAHPGRDLRGPAGRRVAHRQPQRARLGARPPDRRSPTLVLLPLVVALRRARCALLQLGDDTATGLGVRRRAQPPALVLVGVGLAALATAAAGPVVFVAFVAAARSPAASTRAPARPSARSALVGALLVLLLRPRGAAGVRPDRAARRRRHRRRRRPVPAVAARPRQPGRAGG